MSIHFGMCQKMAKKVSQKGVKETRKSPKNWSNKYSYGLQRNEKSSKEFQRAQKNTKEF